MSSPQNCLDAAPWNSLAKQKVCGSISHSRIQGSCRTRKIERERNHSFTWRASWSERLLKSDFDIWGSPTFATRAKESAAFIMFLVFFLPWLWFGQNNLYYAKHKLWFPWYPSATSDHYTSAPCRPRQQVRAWTGEPWGGPGGWRSSCTAHHRHNQYQLLCLLQSWLLGD